ncbi:MAG: DUF4870 domain-containing protein [Chloroflexi bacterium]|nr:DUF4870 domain-containing protein [Chloroflexota bacterium]
MRQSRWQPELKPFATRGFSARANASRGEKLTAALCYFSILLNTVTYGGGLLFCLLTYLLVKGRAAYLEKQATRALIFQCITWGIIIAGWTFYRLLPDWLGNIIFLPLGALVWFIAIIWSLGRAAFCL